MPKPCDRCGKEIDDIFNLVFLRPGGIIHKDGSYCLPCAQWTQLKWFAQEVDGSQLNGDDTPEKIKAMVSPAKVVHVKKMVNWMKTGVGPMPGHGDRFARAEFEGREFDLYMHNVGIYGTRDFPAYFYDNAGNWYRLNLTKYHVPILVI